MRFDYVPWWRSPERGGPTPVSIDIEGFSQQDLIAYMMRCQRTFWEVDLLEYVAMCGPQGGVYLDVGGNIGNHAVFFGKFCADQVVSVEPHPKLVPLARRNLQANGITRAQVLPYAAGAASGVGAIHVREGFEQNIGGSQIVSAVKTDVEVPIQIKTLDEIVDSVRSTFEGRPITFLKMDIEGMEVQALKGSIKVLRQDRPQLLIEIITAEALAEVEGMLGPLGYEQVIGIGNPPSYHFIDPVKHRVRPNLWKGGDPYTHWRDQIEQQVAALVPIGETVIFVDLYQLSIGNTMAGRRRLPFLEKDGQDWGPPPDDQTALTELDRMRRAGARFIGFAWPTYWWFEHYPRFTAHLRSIGRALHEDSRMTLFQLA